MNQLDKHEAKTLKVLNKAHKKLFKKVRSKINVIPKTLWTKKQPYVKDLKHSNQDLLDVLAIAPKFTSIEDYIATVQAYFTSETQTFDYKGIILVYKVGKMKQLIEIVTNQHNIMDGYDKLHRVVFGT